VIAPDASCPNSRLVPWPSCQIHTVMPYAAPSEITFSTNAFNGSTTDRRARVSSSTVTTTMSSTTHHALP
jgi:hypothetical protein